jgi:hypothetical protein
MKRATLAVLAGAAALAVLVAVQGCGVLGGPPTGVAVSAGPDESDSTVVISWTVPAEGGPDKYIIYFRAVTDSGYAIIGETTATSLTHNPAGMTGRYKVTAVFGADEYDGAEKPTTVPISSDTTTLWEINADSSRCGYGWTRDSGIGGVFSMVDSASCADVDFYVSDLQAGFGIYTHKIVSPNVDSIDVGAGIVPKADWRKNGFSDPLMSEQSPLPAYVPPPNATYHTYTEIPGTGLCYVACYTAGETEKHFALIKVNSVDKTSGQMKLQTFYQLVPGLRLIRH